MYPISAVYEDYLKRHDREFLVRATIGADTYDNTRIVDFQIENSLSLTEAFEIGTAIPSKLTIRLRTQEEIPANARIVPYLALSTADLTWAQAQYPWLGAGITWAGGGTEWLPLGEFFVDSRERINDVWVFTCYDKLIWGDALYISSLAFPTTQRAVFDEICSRLGYAYDSSIVINPSFVIASAPTGYTMRQMLGYIASANSASLFTSKDGTVKFKRFKVADPAVIQLTTADYIRVVQTNPVKSYTRVVVTYDTEDGLTYEAGSGDENHTLNIENPFATQEITNSIQATLSGFAYQPLTMDSRGFPHFEQGDTFNYVRYEGRTWLESQTAWNNTSVPWDGLNQYQSIILHQVLSFKGGLKLTIEAPSESEQQSEFPVPGTLTEAVNNLNKTAIKEGKNYYGATITREDGLIVERVGGGSRAVFNSDKLSFQAGGEDKIYFDPVSGKYKFNGTLEATDGVFSGSLSAATGTFAGDLSAAGGTFKGALQAASGSFTGELVAATGSFSGDLNAAGGTFRGALQAASGTFTGNLSAVGGTFTGNLSAAGGTFTGTLVGVDGNFSGAITASTISGGTITGALIRTAASGQRIEVTPTGLRSYDSSGVKRVAISDEGRGNYAGVGFFGSNGSELAGMYTEDNFSFLYAVGPLQIFSFSDRVFFSSNVDFTSATAYGLKISSVIDLQGTLDTKATNMTFDPTSRNLKLWNSNGGLLAQVNIPK
ncbi:hypothetical protein [Paenibacillus sp. FSL L8-0708]|uniref:hypothetical protein n=1 Tax=Paenibacillus sp. FSL L8-0708 TaxID=2975311 RepID=UPI0030F59634